MSQTNPKINNNLVKKIQKTQKKNKMNYIRKLIKIVPANNRLIHKDLSLNQLVFLQKNS